MELWFILAIGGMVLAGISNFIFKLVAKNNLDSEIFSLVGGVTSILFLVPLVFLFDTFYVENVLAVLIIFVASIVAAFIGVWKVYALRFIDTTIYFPLFKLLSPLVAILLGVLLFSESFSGYEWFGLGLGLAVPLLLITKSEKGRQNNLLYGLLLVGVTGTLSAAVAAAHKWATDLSANAITLTLVASVGIIFGSFLAMVIKRGISAGINHIQTVEQKKKIIIWATIRSVVVSSSVVLILYAYTLGGSLAIVHTIHSMYILIPIILSIIFYNEHWNWQKAVAIGLSVVSLAFLG
jgi:drug/metabolite transporter (DMT)-like permease